LKHCKQLTLIIQDDLQSRYQQWLEALKVKLVWDEKLKQAKLKQFFHFEIRLLVSSHSSIFNSTLGINVIFKTVISMFCSISQILASEEILLTDKRKRHMKKALCFSAAVY
jgi:hypothetical protein